MTQAADIVELRTAWRDGAAGAVEASAPVDPLPTPRRDLEANKPADAPVVLLIDDAPAYRSELCRYLRANGFDAVEFDNFAAALAFVRSVPGLFVIVPELTVGSRHLFDCIAQLRRADHAAVLVLSSHQDETETIVALELGADDVIAKTADRREILARIRAAVRRLREPRGDSAPPTPRSPASAGGSWRFLPGQRTLADPEGRPVRLTNAEFNLLEAFVANTGKELHRDELSMLVLGRRGGPGDRGIDNLVAKLRRKLGDPARRGRMIQTARPVGYVFIGFRNLME